MNRLAGLRNYLAGLVVLICLVGGWYSMRATQAMHQRARYTIGYLTGGIYTPKSGKRYSYRFVVRGREYEDTDGREKAMNTTTGARFLVEYDSLNPEISTGHFAVPVPDSVEASPPNGWPEPPFGQLTQ